MIKEVFYRFLIVFYDSKDLIILLPEVIKNSIYLIFFKVLNFRGFWVSFDIKSIARHLLKRNFYFFAQLFIFSTQNLYLYILFRHWLYLASHAFESLAFSALSIWNNYIIMRMVIFTEGTSKRKIIWHIIMIHLFACKCFFNSIYLLYSNLSPTFRSNNTLELFTPNVNIFPNVSKLRKWPKYTSLQLI